MSFITIWLDPNKKYLKTYHDHNCNVTRTKIKTVKQYYVQVMLQANKNPSFIAKVIPRKEDGFIAVDVTTRKIKFT